VSERAVVDTGPLVAIVRAREEAYGRCVAVLKELRAPLLTCWPVFTEASSKRKGYAGRTRLRD
jgi:hypothetical protein